MRLLYIPDADIVYEDQDWGTAAIIREHSDITVHTLGEHFYQLLCQSDLVGLEQEATHLVSALSMYDGIVMHSRFLMWIHYFREHGIYTPFHIIPDYNYFDVKSLFSLYVASRSRTTYDQIYCGSATASKGFSWSGFNTQPFYPLGIDFRAYNRFAKHSKQAMKNALGLDPSKLYIVVCGRLSHDRFVMDFINAIAPLFDALNNVGLIVTYRCGDDEYFEKLNQLTDLLPLNVVVNPDKNVISRYIRASSLSVIPGYSPDETYCHAMYECLSAGTPILVPSHGLFNESLTDQHALFYRCDHDGKFSDMKALLRTLTQFIQRKADGFDEQVLVELGKRHCPDTTMSRFIESATQLPESFQSSPAPVLSHMFAHYDHFDFAQLIDVYDSNRIAYNERYYHQWQESLRRTQLEEKGH